MTNLYKVLGVTDFAGAEEIKTAYRKLSKKFHPDMNDGDKFFEERFKEIQHAYEILTDTNKRIGHDAALKEHLSGDSGYGQTAYREAPAKEEPVPQQPANGKRPRNFSYANFWAISLLIVVTVTVILVSRDQSEKTGSEPLTEAESASVYDAPPPAQDGPAEPLPDAVPAVNGNNGYFTIGSAKEDVLQTQGNPDGVRKYEVLDEEIWSYGRSSVMFRKNKVSEYSNAAGNLNVILTNKPADPAAHFTVGSTKEEVLKAHGNPDEIRKYEVLDEEIWSYGRNSIMFRKNKVSEYSNPEGNLRVTLGASDRTTAARGYFTIGSTKNEVLQVQGDPGSIRKYEVLDEEIWSYGRSSVTFKRGKVHQYSDDSGNLKVRL